MAHTAPLFDRRLIVVGHGDRRLIQAPQRHEAHHGFTAPFARSSPLALLLDRLKEALAALDPAAFTPPLGADIGSQLHF